MTKLLSGIVSPVTIAPDGRRLAFIRLEDQLAEKGKGNSLVVADITGGNERIVQTHNGLERFSVIGPSWSPDGKEIACQLMSGLTKTSDEVWRVVGVDVQSGAERVLTAQQWDGCGRIAWIRDGSGFVMVGTKQGESGTTARDSVWFISQSDGAIRRITTDLSRHNYNSVSLTDDGQSLLVIPFNRTSQIWSVEARGPADPFLEEVCAPPDGRYFVFASNVAGYSHLFRVNRDGVNLRQLTSGESREIDSDCSPDGRWIVYASQSSLPSRIAVFKLWKIPAEGGAPVGLTDHEAHIPHFSPDGRWISYLYPEGQGWRVAVIPADGGSPIKTFKAPNSAELNLGCRWTPDGQALVYIMKGKNFDNLWLLPLNGGAPHALTDFNSGEIYNFAFTRNGRQLFLARGYSIRDVTLIRDFR